MAQEFIPAAKPIIGDEERAAVDAVLKSGMVAQGPQVAAFEEEFSEHLTPGAAAVAVNSHIIAGSGTRVVLTKVLAVNDLSIHLVVGCIGGVLLPLLALKVINKLNIQYLFSAPISKCLEIPYNKLLRKVER